MTSTTAPDLTRWPDLAPVVHARHRSMIATWVLRSATRRADVTVRLPDGRTLGSSTPGAPVLDVRTWAFLDRVGRDYAMGVGEGFMAGEWTPGPETDLGDLLTAFAEHIDTLLPAPLRRVRRLFEPRRPADQRNTADGARDNIGHHYDLSNEMFATFLDETMTYSSAYFGDDADARDLATAQRAKIDRLLDAAAVGAGTRLLEIGTGWGELSIRAARRGAHVHSITLSTEQLRLAEQRAADAGVADRIHMDLRDYRDLDERFDAAVSVEMIEAVGEDFLGAYFGAVGRALEPGGRFGLQAILMPHGRMERSRHAQTWVLKYIFPGGFLPSTEQIVEHAAAAGLRVVGAPFSLRRDYIRTLQTWRRRFTEATGAVGELGFDGPFQRMWVYYLAYSEAGFRSAGIDVAQWTFERQ